jgi:hypothetical protein
MATTQVTNGVSMPFISGAPTIRYTKSENRTLDATVIYIAVVACVVFGVYVIRIIRSKPVMESQTSDEQAKSNV